MGFGSEIEAGEDEEDSAGKELDLDVVICGDLVKTNRLKTGRGSDFFKQIDPSELLASTKEM